MATDDKTDKTKPLSADERAELTRLQEAEAARNEANAKGTALSDGAGQTTPIRRADLEARLARQNQAERDKRATVEVFLRPGRTVYTSAEQLMSGGEIPAHKGGQKLMVTPEEEAKLRAAGHLIGEDGEDLAPSGPKVYQEAGLLVGHAAGQTPSAAMAGKSK